MLFIPEETRKRFLSSDKTEDLRALEISARLRKVGLRPTKQRLNIGKLLFGATHRHITADDLFQEIQTTGQNLSLATIYNTLHHFSEAGLLRRICTGSERVYFDTDTGDHHHFYVQDEDRIVDAPAGDTIINRLPEAPAGYEIAKVDIVIHLKPKQ
ncbi:iron response transcriptional regulator IrrA [Paenochrobactrum sp. BZR 588]|uniref:iron response transcriptional regulator IrrA n=1 Tax=unclassified Paenochrobactrum TaxID=2639760 RepID=UPI0038527E8D